MSTIRLCTCEVRGIEAKQEWLNSIAFLPLLFSRLYLYRLKSTQFSSKGFSAGTYDV